jgi:glycosyltransferase involved in cell wall biosynthesis
VAIPNGVPVPEIAWQPRPDWHHAPRAVFVGRLAPEKGLRCLIQAWPIVRLVHPQACLSLIGEGPEQPGLESLAHSLGLNVGRGQPIELPGRSADVTTVLRDFDLFVLPSLEEGMSIALLEAMALGLPLVASSIPGNRRLVNDPEHGRLVPPDDPAALAETILAQWADFDRACAMGRAARSRVERESSIAAVARRHLAWFEDIMRNPRN